MKDTDHEYGIDCIDGTFQIWHSFSVGNTTVTTWVGTSGRMVFASGKSDIRKFRSRIEAVEHFTKIAIERGDLFLIAWAQQLRDEAN